MKRASSALAIALMALGGCSQKNTPSSSESSIPPPPMIPLEMRMQAATKLARHTLSDLEQRLAYPPPSQSFIAVKGRFEEEGLEENLWIGDLTVAGDEFRGKIVTEPVRLKKLGWGQPATLHRDQVLDWFAIEDGKLVGGYALRVERSLLSAIERADFDASMGFRVVD
jgi:uncharacterized protein YegJ (DUF2314 family)